MSVSKIIVEVNGLTRIFLHKAAVYEGPVLDWDEGTGPTNPGKGHGLFAAGESGDETTGRHLEVIFALCILGDGDGESVGDDDEARLRVRRRGGSVRLRHGGEERRRMVVVGERRETVSPRVFSGADRFSLWKRWRSEEAS